MKLVINGDTRYVAMATAELKKRIEDELLMPDPPKEMAKAILGKVREKADRDSQGTPRYYLLRRRQSQEETFLIHDRGRYFPRGHDYSMPSL